MTQEDKKQVASQAYALENFTDIVHLTKLRNAWLVGYETATSKWIKEVTLKPDNDRMVLIKIKDYRIC